MEPLRAVSLAVILMATTAGAGVAAVGSDQAREANAQNAAGTSTQSPPATDQARQTHQTNPPASGQTTGSGNSVGPGAGGNTPLGYAKGAGENSSVGKQH